MRLKTDVTVIPIDSDYIIIDTASNTSEGQVMVKTNETGARIIQLLSDGECNSESQLIEALCSEYDAGTEMITVSVRRVIQCLLEAGFLIDS